MARKQIVYTSTHGRDNGKVFEVTEMSALQASKWARMALSRIAKDGYLPEGIKFSDGVAGLAEAGYASMCFCESCWDLLDELIACAKVKTPAGVTREIIMDVDVEEQETITDLHLEAYKLIVDFSKAADN
jgi:hypothetical protein